MPAQRIITIIVILGIIALGAYLVLIPKPEVEEEIPDAEKIRQATEEIQISGCCAQYLESDFTEYSMCPKDYNLGLTTAIIKQDESFYVVEFSEAELNDTRLQFVANASDKIGRYFVYLFGNEYLGKSEDADGAKEDLMNACNAFAGPEMCSEFIERMNIESEPYFPGVMLAKNYFEKENFCSGEETSFDLCRAIATGNASFCETTVTLP